MSSFGGNELLISPDWLIEDGLLRASDFTLPAFPERFVDYAAVLPFKRRLLEMALDNFNAGACPELRVAFEQFCADQAHWLEDYALFRVLKARYNDVYYLEWPIELVQRNPAALAQVRRDLVNEIDVVRFAQFQLFRQGERVKRHARAKGILLIGDLPFFVSPDSSDVWANPDLFLLDQRRRPQFVAGVPPDYFSSEGQLWGNPVFNWAALQQTGYRWCIDRIRSLLAHVDVIRLDHFRGFAAAWHVPSEATTARSGQWALGPGADFFRAVRNELGCLPFIAEDLGLITPDVSRLRDEFEVPGVRVLQFAFDGSANNPYLPYNYCSNTVVYTGTHDNPPSREWHEELPPCRRENFQSYLNEWRQGSNEAAWDLMRLAWSSKAALAIAPLQDLLNLGSEARMNVPGRAGGNWTWRASEEMFSASAFDALRELTRNSNRIGPRDAQANEIIEAA
jgi:4-alpha-glucanotransferase